MEKVKLAILAALGALAPIQAALLTVFALIVVDLITGILAAWKIGNEITSSKMKKTVVKLFVYELAITMAYFVGLNLTGPTLPVLNIVASVVGVTELKSVLENLDILTGGGVVKSILGALNTNKDDK